MIGCEWVCYLRVDVPSQNTCTGRCGLVWVGVAGCGCSKHIYRWLYLFKIHS